MTIDYYPNFDDNELLRITEKVSRGLFTVYSNAGIILAYLFIYIILVRIYLSQRDLLPVKRRNSMRRSLLSLLILLCLICLLYIFRLVRDFAVIVDFYWEYISQAFNICKDPLIAGICVSLYLSLLDVSSEEEGDKNAHTSFISESESIFISDY